MRPQTSQCCLWKPPTPLLLTIPRWLNLAPHLVHKLHVCLIRQGLQPTVLVTQLVLVISRVLVIGRGPHQAWASGSGSGKRRRTQLHQAVLHFQVYRCSVRAAVQIHSKMGVSISRQDSQSQSQEQQKRAAAVVLLALMAEMVCAVRLCTDRTRTGKGTTQLPQGTYVMQRRNRTPMVVGKECNSAAKHVPVLTPTHFMQACSVNEQFFCLRVFVLALSIRFVCHDNEALHMPTSHSCRQNRPKLHEGMHAT